MEPAGASLTIDELTQALVWKADFQPKQAHLQLTLSELDRYEDTLNRSICAIRTLRNAQCRINTLPPETLASIFSLVQSNVRHLRPVLSDFCVNDWLPVTRVCRHWRETAMTFSSLWSTIDLWCAHNDNATLFLQRSASSPLHVYYAAWKPNSKEGIGEAGVLDLLGHNAYRFKQFNILSRWPLEAQWSAFTQPAPMLESISVSVTKPGNAVSILPCLFGGTTPLLRHLTIYYFSSWTNNFQDLTHISLHFQSRNNRYSFSEFLDFLRASPLLIELALINAGPRMDDILAQPEQVPVSLDSLESLELGQWPSLNYLSIFLSALTVPRTVNLSIWGDDLFISTRDDLEFVFPLHASHRACLLDLTEINVSFSWSADFHQLIAIKSRVLYIQGDVHPRQYFSLAKMVPLDDVTRLTVTYTKYNAPDTAAHRTFFAAMPALTHLSATVSGNSLRPLICALGLSSPSSSEDEPFLCPNLTSVSIHDPAPDSSLLLALLFEKRAAVGMPVRTARLGRCEIDDLPYIQRVVKEVVLIGTAPGEDPTEASASFLPPVVGVWPTDASLWPIILPDHEED